MASTCSESDASMRQRLFTSLSQSYPGSALSKALHFMDSDDEEEDMKPDQLSSSCFAELSMERSNDNNDNNDDESDDDLTSLEWLQGANLLKNLNADETSQKENGNPLQVEGHLGQTHPPHIPYNPHKHVNTKPPYSFSCLIFMAVEDSPQKRLPVKDIYNWILTHFPYFQHAPTGWKNSVRHNLSLNKCFKKVDKDRGQAIGKGSLWCIDPDYRPHLLQALRKTPYHPYHQLQMLATPQMTQQGLLLNKPLPLSPQISNINQISPYLFPFLSKRLAEAKPNLDLADIEIANTLVALKSRSQSSNGSLNREFAQRIRKRLLSPHRHKVHSNVTCTNFPSDDHTYSTMTSPGNRRRADSPSSSIDDEYDFGSDDDIEDDDVMDYSSCHSDYDEIDGDIDEYVRMRKRKITQMHYERAGKRRTMRDDDENMKTAEGANALLNLAGIMNTHIMPLRSISPENDVTPVRNIDMNSNHATTKNNENESALDLRKKENYSL